MKSLYVFICFIFCSVSFGQTSSFEFNDEIVTLAPCKAKVPLTNQELIAWTKSLRSEPLPWIQVGKKVFRNEHVELALIYRKLLSIEDIKIKFRSLERKMSDGQIRPWTQKINVGDEIVIDYPTRSDTVLGALQEIFGQREGLQLAYLLYHYRFNGSHFRYRDVSAWKAEELDALILAAADMPLHQQPFFFDQQMTKFARGYSRAMHKENVLADTMAGERVNYFDLWSQGSLLMQQTTVVHELAHVVSAQSGFLSEEKLWRSTSRWSELKAGKYKFEGPRVTEYATTSPEEDFAESFTAYLCAPHYLKTAFPGKYDFLKKNVFKGEEYGSQSSCNGMINSRTLSRAASLISQVKFNKLNLVKSAKEAQNLCAWGPQLKQCLMQVLKDQQLQELLLKTEKDLTLSPMQRRKNFSRLISIPTEMVEELYKNVASLHAKTIAWKVKSRIIYTTCEEIAFESQFLFNNSKSSLDQGELNHAQELKTVTEEICQQTKKRSSPPYLSEEAIEQMALRALLGTG